MFPLEAGQVGSGAGLNWLVVQGVACLDWLSWVLAGWTIRARRIQLHIGEAKKTVRTRASLLSHGGKVRRKEDFEDLEDFIGW